uniref:Uncharacterized protein n=1 Tax=Paenibacillus athensensis TaxID=1967502 RepID=A0A4Y8Q6F6_9BACL
MFHDHIKKFVASDPKGMKQSIVFSDSVIIVWNTVENAIDGCAELFSNVFDSNGFLFDQYYADDYKYRSLLLRGAISEGSLEIEDEENGVNIHQRFIIGSALSRSAKGESLLKGSRLILLGDWDSTTNQFLDNISLSPKSKKCREILWPKYITKFNSTDRFRWILNLCELYRQEPVPVLRHYRDTLWLFLRSALSDLDEKHLLEIVTQVIDSKFIDLENSFWAPITLAISDIFIKYTNLQNQVIQSKKILGSVLNVAALTIMENK